MSRHVVTRSRSASPARCRADAARLDRYLDGALTPARARALERHLEDCPCCARALASLKRAIRACREAGRCRLPPDVRARARARIRALLDAPR